jgi:hypothetical protein
MLFNLIIASRIRGGGIDRKAKPDAVRQPTHLQAIPVSEPYT